MRPDPRPAPRRDERGLAVPSPLVMLSVVAVAMAALAFVLTGNRGDDVAPPAATPAAASQSPTAAATPAAEPTTKKKEKRTPAVKRAQVFVEVFNNSGITGLAARRAADISGAGWNVVGTDNWYGTIPATTVYYPPRLQAAGKALARDLGVSRVLPAVEPMSFDRLTVILTGE